MAPRRSWHRCQRWFRRGYPCPYRQLGVPDEEDSDEDSERRSVPQFLPVPLVGERNKREPVSNPKIINIEDYINEQPPIDVPVPGRVAAATTRGAGVPSPAEVPVFRPQPGRSGTAGAGVPLPQESWNGSGARELANGITSGVSPGSAPPELEAAISLWTAPKTVSIPMSAKVVHAPRFGEAPLPFFENELARATIAARKGAPATLPSPVYGVRSKPQAVRHSFGTPPAEIARETKGVIPSRPRSNYSQRPEQDNTWGVAATVASAMAAIAIYALGRGGIDSARAIEKAITARIPDNRASSRPGGVRGSVRPGGQVFDFWEMLNGVGFQ